MAITTTPRGPDRVDAERLEGLLGELSVPSDGRERLDGTAPDVYVGETETDRAFARATGMRFVHLTRDERGVRTLRSLRDRLE